MTEREEKAKAWLNRNYMISMEVSAIQRRLEKMESDLEKCTKPIKLREIQVSHSGNSQEEMLADYIDMADDLSKRLLYLMKLDGATLKVIEKVDSPILRTILTERYVNRLKWEKIAELLHYEKTRVFDLHLQALDAVMPYIPKEVLK